LEGVSSWERRYIELGNFKNWIAYMGGIGSSSGRKMPAKNVLEQHFFISMLRRERMILL
jgi:hypothetical protein